MKKITNYITEKLKISKDSKIEYNYHPKDSDELKSLVDKLIKEKGDDADLNDIDTSNITDMNHIFSKYSFSGDVSSWDVSNVTNMEGMFVGCQSLKELDLSNWDVSNCTNFSFMFAGCDKFIGNGLDKWNVSKAKSLVGMFKECFALDFDFSNWKFPKCRDIRGIFANCHNLKKIKDIEKWDTSNVWYFDQIFWGMKDLDLDLSRWNTSNARTMSSLFAYTRNLKVSGLDKWDMSKIRNIDEMFTCAEVSQDCDILSQNNKWKLNDRVSMREIVNYSNIKYYPRWYKK